MWSTYKKCDLSPKTFFFKFSLQIRISRVILPYPWIGFVKIYPESKNFEFKPRISKSRSLCLGCPLYPKGVILEGDPHILFCLSHQDLQNELYPRTNFSWHVNMIYHDMLLRDHVHFAVGYIMIYHEFRLIYHDMSLISNDISWYVIHLKWHIM